MPQQTRPRGIEMMMNSPVGKWFPKVNAWVYRTTGGKVWSEQGAARLLLLTTRGRKSGKPRTVPLVYLEDGTNYIVVGSKMGHPTHPLWYLNLVAEPRVDVQLGDSSLPMLARTAEGEERADLWPKLLAVFPDYGQYQQWTDREIPVVVLSPRPD